MGTPFFSSSYLPSVFHLLARSTIFLLQLLFHLYVPSLLLPLLSIILRRCQIRHGEHQYPYLVCFLLSP